MRGGAREKSSTSRDTIIFGPAPEVKNPDGTQARANPGRRDATIVVVVVLLLVLVVVLVLVLTIVELLLEVDVEVVVLVEVVVTMLVDVDVEVETLVVVVVPPKAPGGASYAPMSQRAVASPFPSTVRGCPR